MSTTNAESTVKGVAEKSDWIKAWDVGDIGFHQSEHDKFLDDKEAEMFEGKKKSVFLPLCGKSLDIVWLYNHGHTVCGVELAELAIQQFFGENNIDFEMETIKDIGKLYKSKDGRIQLYVADMFDMSPELCGQFDIIFDSKSFVAINKCDREKYINITLALMKNEGRYYLSTIEYDSAVWPGPPHSSPIEVIRSCFGDRCNIELLEDADAVIKEKPAISENTPTPAKQHTDFPSALRDSSHLLFRWYKLALKQQ